VASSSTPGRVNRDTGGEAAAAPLRHARASGRRTTDSATVALWVAVPPQGKPCPILVVDTESRMPRMAHTVPSIVVEFLDRAFSQASEQITEQSARFPLSQGHSAQLAALVALVDSIPTHLLPQDSIDFAELIAGKAAIEVQIERWSGGKSGTLEVCGFGNLSPVTLVRRALAKCPDEAVPEETAGLLFVTDSALRESLRLDLAAAERALTHADWKAATVLAGSVVEALLLEAIRPHNRNEIAEAFKAASQRDAKWHKPSDSDPTTWGLGHYVEVAFEFRLIKEHTRVQCSQTKDFRNLIHPGRSQRLAMSCSRGTALAALAAVTLVIEEFEKRASPAAPPVAPSLSA
jgi:hypothetical protein